MAMAVNENLSRSLREALYETLTAILSPMQDVRTTAEEQIKALEVTEEFGIHLAELTLDPNGPLEIRQLASVLLKQYVECHWSSFSKKFYPPEVSEPVKAAVRQMLPMGLKESISKVRSSVAYAISAIAHWDWPEQWPQLFDILMESLKTGDCNAVHGAMRALTELCREVTDTQMPAVAPVIFPEMYRIFVAPEKYDLNTRRRAVEIFCTCTTMIANMAEYNKEIAKTLLFPFLLLFTEALVQSLQDKNPTTTDSGLKMEALKTLTVLVRHFPHRMASWLPQILTPVWNTLTESASVYVRSCVNDSEEENEVVDSDGEVLGFENLVFGIFELVHGLVEAPKFRTTVRKGMDDLIYYIVLYMQITEEQTRMWIESPDRFVEDEDDETFSYSVRISAQDVLLALSEEFGNECATGLVSAVTKHIQEADLARLSGSPHWWKIYESCMLAIGTTKELIITKLQSGKLNFDLPGFLQNIVLVQLSVSTFPFLTGRCMWIASCYPTYMSLELLQRFLQVAVSSLQDPNSPVVKISAVRALWGFFDHLKSSGKSEHLTPYLEPILEGLISLATRFAADVLSLVLETLSVVLSVNESFTSACEHRVTPLALAIFLKYNSDPVIIAQVQDVLKELVRNSLCRPAVEQRVLPTLISILNAPVDKIPGGLQAVSLDILQTIVRASGTPLSRALVEQAFPAVVQCTLRTDDNSTMQNGGECLRSYAAIDLPQVAQWHDDQGRDGLWYAVQVAARLLDPRASEFTATFVGRLVSTLAMKAGTLLGENLDLLLKAVLSKMQQAESLAVIQSLVMVFAHLFNNQMEAVLEFLSGVPGPTGKPALEFVLVEWCSKQHLFYGCYERKISTLALCKLLQHGITTEDPRLGKIQIKGDLVITSSDRVKTRSQAKNRPDEWTVIPLLVKICKLIINELSNVVELSMIAEKDDKDDEDDDDWGGREDAEDNDENLDQDSLVDESSAIDLNVAASNFTSASDYAGLYDEGDMEDEDADMLADPLNSVDLRNYLGQFFQSLVQQPYYAMFEGYFSQQEKEVLTTLGITS